MAVEREDGDENRSGSEMRRTRKQPEWTDEADSAAIMMRTMENSNEDPSSVRTLKQPRLVWTPQLHKWLYTNQTRTENSSSPRIRSRPTLRSDTTLLFAATRPSPQMEYLKPVSFYKKIFKDILKKEDHLKPGRLLGLDVSDKYVSLAVSDWKNLTAVPLRVVDRQEINMSSMADMIQSLIPEYNLVGFVFGAGCIRPPIDVRMQKFIDDLCETGKFKGLKYTFWDYGIASQNAEFVFKQHVKFTLEILNQPPYMSETIMEMSLAVFALQGYLDCTKKLVKEDWD
ncbi:hypothetical protein EZV62_003166 [Acer yangbiense]|uniref:YqgF/RNase H-like domain-containing protein n=1 Tax=Acer yangbiense TaxID=1000413 RepID=A0A5C7IGG3_9ROSI|nr:hypothetical protein EZV62_003166 [Acer yangbiense]